MIIFIACQQFLFHLLAYPTPSFLFSYNFVFTNLSSPVSADQLPLGVESALECGCYTVCHSIEESQLSFYYHQSTITSSPVRGWTSHLPTILHAGILSVLSLPGPCDRSPNHCEFTCALYHPVMSRKHCFFKSSMAYDS